MGELCQVFQVQMELLQGCWGINEGLQKWEASQRLRAGPRVRDHEILACLRLVFVGGNEDEVK